jgi:hypothetical protein
MCGVFALVVALQQAPAFAQATVSGIVVTEFEAPQGRFQIYLPQDMAAGDTLSGMVYTEPRGTGSEREANEKVLQGVVVSIDSDMATRDGTRIVLRAIDRSHRLSRSLRATIGTTTYSAPLQLDPARRDVTPRFRIPEVSPAGRPMTIVGTFDGDNGTTNVSVGGKAASVLVETPRTCVVSPDPSFVGRKSVSVSDGGRAGDGTVVLPKISLSAGKTALARGETTKLTVRVEGLEGLASGAYPIPIELRNETPSIINLARYTNFGIEQSAVSDGVFTRSFDITATSAGSFVVTGVLFMVKLDDAKKAMTPEEMNAWLAGLKAMYEDQIKKLESQPANGGRTAAINRKKRILEQIASLMPVSDEGGKQDAANTMDKLLSDESFFDLAADLISLAADFLGYTDIPMPGLGALIKGAKVVVKKLPKVLELLEKAEKLHEELEKIKDAKEKLDKAKELKDALDKAKSALEGEK